MCDRRRQSRRRRRSADDIVSPTRAAETAEAGRQTQTGADVSVRGTVRSRSSTELNEMQLQPGPLSPLASASQSPADSTGSSWSWSWSSALDTEASTELS